MISLLAFPVARWLAGFVIVLAVLASIYANGRIDGRASAVAKIEAANAKTETKADAAERDVLECPPGKWNREAGRCER